MSEHANVSEVCRDSSIFYDAQETLLRSSESQHIKFAHLILFTRDNKSHRSFIAVIDNDND